jgi:hypothetical protein
LSNQYRRGCGAERRATPLGLSKDHISPPPMKQPVDFVDTNDAERGNT